MSKERAFNIQSHGAATTGKANTTVVSLIVRPVEKDAMRAAATAEGFASLSQYLRSITRAAIVEAHTRAGIALPEGWWDRVD